MAGLSRTTSLILLLVLGIRVHITSSQAPAAQPTPVKPAEPQVNQNATVQIPSPPAPIHTPPSKPASTNSSTRAADEATSSTTTADLASISDTAVFLLGSGLALLIALLAWGEQIRAITQDTRDLERDFLDTTGLTRAELSALLQAKNDDDRLLAFTNLMASGKLTSAPQVEILPLFEKWRILGATLRSLQSKKYWLTVSLTVVFLATGTVMVFTRSTNVPFSLLLAAPATLVVLILVTIISAGRVEQQLNALLMQMGEKV